MAEYDIVIVGSGINSLVCGASLARRGKRVCILERNALPGGCIRTEELTLPGFVHDTLSTLYPLFVTAPHFPPLQDALAERGANFLNGTAPTAVLRPNRQWAVLSRDREENMAAFERMTPGDGLAYQRAMQEVEQSADLTYGLLGTELWTAAAAKLLAKHAWRQGPRWLSEYFASALQSGRAWLEAEFKSELARALIAPWVLHVGLSPESAMSALMGKLIVLTLEQAGAPVVEGGSASLVNAFARLIRDCGGEIHCNADVNQVKVLNHRARGVTTADGREFDARTAVVCDVTPTQLYGRLLATEEVPANTRARARAYRYGRADMQIHLALDAPPQWPASELQDVAMLHVTNGLDAVSAAVNQSQCGLLPAEATIVVAQPVAVDPTRAPIGKSILWIQLQELPSRIRGDALGDIQCPSDGRWTPEVRERYADRIVGRLERLIPNLRGSLLDRKVLSPVDIEALNVNLVGGDPYSGSCEVDQFLLWRPFPGARNHSTSVERLYHIGAGTHPGPGLGGMSGFMAANAIR